jgi:hypothetical protein
MMELFCINNEIFEKEIDRFPLLDSILVSLQVYSSETEGVCIELVFDISHRRHNKRMKLVFKKVLQYSFYYDSSFAFYNVESFKFFPIEDKGQFYLSLAPDDEVAEISDDDEDFILAENAVLYYQ